MTRRARPERSKPWVGPRCTQHLARGLKCYIAHWRQGQGAGGFGRRSAEQMSSLAHEILEVRRAGLRRLPPEPGRSQRPPTPAGSYEVHKLFYVKQNVKSPSRLFSLIHTRPGRPGRATAPSPSGASAPAPMTFTNPGAVHLRSVEAGHVAHWRSRWLQTGGLFQRGGDFHQNFAHT